MSKHDPVNSPSHYTQGGLEPIEAIEAWKLGFCLGNAVKYIARAGKKDHAKTVEDLKKARWFLNREIASHVADEYNDESGETIIEAAERISLATGYDHHTVISTALWLYQEAIDAKRAGKHVGVARMTGLLETEWHGLFEGDDYDGDEEEEAEEECVTPDESKTVACYRCVKCGMLIVAGTERGKDIAGGLTVMYHFGCFPDEAKAEKPKFAVGDKVVLANIDTACVGVIKGVQVNDDKETAYEVAWTAQTGDARFESELKPFDGEPEKPKFKFGDKVRAKWGTEDAVVYGIRDDGNLKIFWTANEIYGVLFQSDAVLVND